VEDDMLLCLTVEGQENVSWEQWVALAEACEVNGFAGLFRSDHYMPFRRPPEWGVTDAWATITALSGVTDRIQLGTLVSPVGFRHPAELAKVVITADHVSGGRVELGLGAGWFAGEHRAFGFPFPPVSVRHSVLAEYVEVVHRLWDPAEARITFAGRHFTLEDCVCLPKGVHRPHPPLIVGGDAGPHGAALAARWADEYNLYFLTPQEVLTRRAELSRACEAAGRDPETLRISLMLNVLIGENARDLEARAVRLADKQGGEGGSSEVGGLGPERLVGTPDQIIERLQAYADAGVQRVMLQHLLHEDLESVEMVGTRVVPQVASM
jgi:F420-dependent oxidoreductase-like protein